MPVRRSRAEQLALIPRGGGDPIVLFAETREPGELTTQDIFQVSPDGAHLAYAAKGVLHVRASDGSERTLAEYTRWGRMRFSPDGAYLAAIVGEPNYSPRGERVVLMDLATGTTRELAAFDVARQLEWMRDAVVVQEWDHAHGHDVLTELPIAPGSAPTVQLDPFTGAIDKFVAAGNGTRIVAFVGEASGYRVLSVDADTAGAPKTLGVFSDYVTNAAESLDGQRLAFTTPSAVFMATGDEHPHAISERSFVRSLWFARDGRLGYASEKSATILAAPGQGTASARHFDTEGPISMLRFDPTSERALVATPTHAWDIAPAKPAYLTTIDSGTLLGVDSFAGGLVVWSD